MKKNVLTVALAAILCVVVAVSAAAGAPRLVDGADLLSDKEEETLLEKLDTISEKHRVDVVVVTVESVGSITASRYAERFYDQNSYGFGDTHDGVLLLISMEERDYRILSNGLGADAISMDDIDAIGEKIVPYLSDGDYAEAFDAFADACDYEINGEINGFPFAFGRNLLIALVIGLAVALVVTGILCAQLKSVHRKSSAAGYTKENSMQITQANEFYLYRTLHRTRKAESSSSRSGGGSSRNVGGGKF